MKYLFQKTESLVLTLTTILILMASVVNAQVTPPGPNFISDTLVCDSLNSQTLVNFSLENVDPGETIQIWSVPIGEIITSVVGPGPHSVNFNATQDTFLIAWRTNLNSADTLIVHPCFSGNPFPVQWGYFEAKQFNNKGNTLNWSTLTEQNVSHFIVSRKIDDGDWIILASDIPATGNSTDTKRYHYTDNQAWEYGQGEYYYKVGEVDFNGSDTVWTHVEQVSFDPGKVTMVPYPNPCSEVLNIAMTGDIESWTYYLTDGSGRTILSGKVEGTLSTEVITQDLASGLYFLRVLAGNDIFFHRIVIR
jgi:hypothetical protein